MALTLRKERCKGCNICVAFCPKAALALEHEKAVPIPERCVACGMCELYCPDMAICVMKAQKPPAAAGEEERP